jgi:hypothetical protein
MATTHTETDAVLTNHVANHVWVNSRWKCLSVGGS